MRRFKMAIVLMLVVLGLCTYGNRSLDSLMQELSNHVLQADELMQMEKNEEALAVLQESYHAWQEHQLMLGALVHHDDLDLIENNYLRALQYIRNDQKDEYLVETTQLHGLLQHLVDFTRFKVINVF